MYIEANLWGVNSISVRKMHDFAIICPRERCFHIPPPSLLLHELTKYPVVLYFIFNIIKARAFYGVVSHPRRASCRVDGTVATPWWVVPHKVLVCLARDSSGGVRDHQANLEGLHCLVVTEQAGVDCQLIRFYTYNFIKKHYAIITTKVYWYMSIVFCHFYKGKQLSDIHFASLVKKTHPKWSLFLKARTCSFL